MARSSDNNGQAGPSRTLERTRKIVSDPIAPLMVRLTVPMTGGIVAIMFLGLADTWFISFLGTEQLAAAGFIIPVYMICVSIALGLGMGISSIASRLVGEAKHQATARYVTDAQLFVLLFTIALSALLGVFMDAVFSGMGATRAVLPHIRSYMLILVAGLPLLMFVFVCNNTFRAVGAVKTSAAMLMLLSSANFILDPLLIFGIGPFPRLGIKGAALATVISGAGVFVISMYFLIIREKLLLFTVPRLGHVRENWAELLHIAAPAMIANTLAPITALVMTTLIAAHGTEAVAGFGVGFRIEALSLIIVFALSSTLPMFIGQNLGAGRFDRVRQALFGCLNFSIFLQIAVYVLLLMLSPWIPGAFSDDPGVTRVIRSFIYILPLTYGAHAIVILATVSLNVLKRPRLGLFIMIIRLAACYLPLAWLGGQFWGIIGLFSGAAAGNIIAGIIAYRVMLGVCADEERRLSAAA